MTEPTNAGQRLIEAWEKAADEVDRCRREVGRAECHLVNTINNLGRWMDPGDMKEGETISVWYGNRLIAVTKRGNNSYEIKIRQRRK